MNPNPMDNYMRILEIAKQDSEYLELHQILQPLNTQLLDLIERLDNTDTATIIDYIGVVLAIEMRLLKIACLSMVFPE